MELSKSVPEFVEKWVCLHTGIDKTMKATMEQDLKHMIWSAMENVIDMYVEMLVKHGHNSQDARAKALLEISEGLNVDLR